jgi:hypothetical protein
MICRLSAASSNSVTDLRALDPADLTTLAEEVRQREERESWSNMTEALARIFDLLSVMRVENLARGGVKKWNLPEPARMPRPGDELAEARAITPAEAARLMMAG